jgi:26S proteasome regulatory subunit N2
VVGIAVEAKNLDILRESMERAGDEGGKGKSKDQSGKREDLMDYLLDICLNVIQERVFRNEVRTSIHTPPNSFDRFCRFFA